MWLFFSFATVDSQFVDLISSLSRKLTVNNGKRIEENNYKWDDVAARITKTPSKPKIDKSPGIFNFSREFKPIFTLAHSIVRVPSLHWTWKAHVEYAFHKLKKVFFAFAIVLVQSIITAFLNLFLRSFFLQISDINISLQHFSFRSSWEIVSFNMKNDDFLSQTT